MKSSLALAGLLALFGLVAGCSSAETESASDDGPQVSDLTSAIDVRPYAVIGSGQGGAGAEDNDAPDGVAFDANGSLLLTDAANHRVQIWSVAGVPKKLGEDQAPATGPHHAHHPSECCSCEAGRSNETGQAACCAAT